MILNIVITDTPEGERFKVLAGEDPNTLDDVTDRYRIVATETPDGETGFVVLARKPET